MLGSKSATSPALLEEGRTAKRRLFKALAPLGYIYVVEYRSLVEEPELGVGADLSRKVDFFLTDPLYSVQMA